MSDYLALARRIIERRNLSETVAQKAQEAKEAPLYALNALLTHPNRRNAGASADRLDLLELFQERAAIREFDGRRPRHLAERLAYGEVIETWCRHHPQQLDPGTCAGCGRPIGEVRLELPDGGQVHFGDNEFQCLIRYGGGRRRRAISALAQLGIVPPPGWEF
jgi:hypothetical protein